MKYFARLWKRYNYFLLLLFFTVLVLCLFRLYRYHHQFHLTVSQQKALYGHSYSKALRGFLIPKDSILLSATEDSLFDIYWRYVNTIQALCYNQTRLGSLRDGGKDVCVDDEFRLQKPCLVYSFGSASRYDFEIDVLNRYGCTVHTFDPSNITGTHRHPNGVNFHFIGLGSKDVQNKQKWEMRRLSTILKNLNHEEKMIDILKIDIEGGEWDALPEMITTGSLRNVRQICMEVHFNRKFGELVNQLQILRTVYEKGFRIFMRDHNIYYKEKKLKNGYITPYNEVSLLNTQMYIESRH